MTMASLVTDEASILPDLAHTRHGLVAREAWLVPVASVIIKVKCK